MTALLTLNPKWIGLLRAESGEGIELDCPSCGPEHRISAYFVNPLDDKATAGWHSLKWQREGNEWTDLTLSPSINYPCWHGWIENGKVFNVSESPLTALLTITGETEPKLVALSPRQSISLCEQVSSLARNMLSSVSSKTNLGIQAKL